MTDPTAQQLLNRAQDAWREGSYNEEMFADLVCKVLDLSGVDYAREKPLGSDDGRGPPRRCDVYIPETDTAIELKVEASLRGVGQAAYYAQHASEALLIADGDPLADGHSVPARKACDAIDDVAYGLAIPGPHRNPPVLKVMSDDQSHFLDAGDSGDLGDHRFLIQSYLGDPE